MDKNKNHLVESKFISPPVLHHHHHTICCPQLLKPSQLLGVLYKILKNIIIFALLERQKILNTTGHVCQGEKMKKATNGNNNENVKIYKNGQCLLSHP